MVFAPSRGVLYYGALAALVFVMIAALEKRLHQASNTRELFSVRWSVG